MAEPRDERFIAPPAIGKADPADYPRGKKPGEEGFLEALAEDSEFEFVDKTK